MTFNHIWLIIIEALLKDFVKQVNRKTGKNITNIFLISHTFSRSALYFVFHMNSLNVSFSKFPIPLARSRYYNVVAHSALSVMWSITTSYFLVWNVLFYIKIIYETLNVTRMNFNYFSVLFLRTVSGLCWKPRPVSWTGINCLLIHANFWTVYWLLGLSHIVKFSHFILTHSTFSLCVLFRSTHF